MFKLTNKGSFENTEKFLNNIKDPDAVISILHKYGKIGVQALRAATPINSGITADSWYYVVKKNEKYFALYFCNSKNTGRIPVVFLLEYGHVNINGEYISPIPFVNRVIQPIFDNLYKEVKAVWA